MININEVFLSKMLQEIGFTFQHGVNLKTPATYSLPPKEIISNNLSLPKSLLDFYNQTSGLNIIWELQETEENTKQFKEDKFLIKNYLENDYDWGVVHEYLSGSINLTEVENLLNPDFCKDQAYYYTLSNKLENQEDFFPFDTCWSVTACLKKEGNEIIDNIWLVHSDAEALYDMGITIEEYLNLAYQAKGFHYWQLIYLFKEKTEYHELMKRFLPKLLPNVTLDLTGFDIEKDIHIK